MKKKTMKRLLSISFVCIILGGLLCGTAYLMGARIDDSFTMLTIKDGKFYIGASPMEQLTNEETSEFISLEDMTSFSFSGECVSVRVEQGEENGIQFHNISKKNIKIEKDNQGGVHIEVNFDNLSKRKDGEVVVTLRSDAELSAVSMEINKGSIDVASLKANTMEFTSNMGDIDAKNLYANTISIENNMGDGTYQIQEVKQVELENEMGDVDVDYAQDLTTIDYTIETEMGDVVIDGKNYSSGVYSSQQSNVLMEIENHLGDVVIH